MTDNDSEPMIITCDPPPVYINIIKNFDGSLKDPPLSEEEEQRPVYKEVERWMKNKRPELKLYNGYKAQLIYDQKEKITDKNDIKVYG